MDRQQYHGNLPHLVLHSVQTLQGKVILLPVWDRRDAGRGARVELGRPKTELQSCKVGQETKRVSGGSWKVSITRVLMPDDNGRPGWVSAASNGMGCQFLGQTMGSFAGRGFVPILMRHIVAPQAPVGRTVGVATRRR